MRKQFLMGIGVFLFSGALYAGNFWPNSGFEIGSDGAPDSFHRKGQDKEMQCWGSPAASGNYSMGIIDNRTDAFSSWMSEKVVLPPGTAGKTVILQWKELCDIIGKMRLSVTFRTVENDLIRSASVQIFFSGSSDGWSTQSFAEKSQTVDVPADAESMMITLTSSGGPTATGTCYIDNLEVVVD